MSLWRSRWAAFGAAVAITLGGGGIGLVNAIDSGDKPVLITIQPQRIMDTRGDLGLPGRFVSSIARELQVTGEVPIAAGGTATVVPSDAIGVLVNVTVVFPDGPGYLALAPGGATGIPSTSTVNFTGAGTVEPNAATVDLGPGGTMQVYLFTALQGGTADVLLDVVGYTVDHTHDDRYYTEGEVDQLLEDAEGTVGPRGPAGPQGPAGPTGPFNGSDIVNDSLTAADIADEPGVFFQTEQITSSVPSGNSDTVMSLVVGTLPAPGYVVVTTSGLVEVDGHTIRCSLFEAGTGSLYDSGSSTAWDGPVAPLALTRTFEVDAGDHTFGLVCRRFLSAGSNSVRVGELTAMYFPTSYPFNP